MCAPEQRAEKKQGQQQETPNGDDDTVTNSKWVLKARPQGVFDPSNDVELTTENIPTSSLEDDEMRENGASRHDRCDLRMSTDPPPRSGDAEKPDGDRPQIRGDVRTTADGCRRRAHAPQSSFVLLLPLLARKLLNNDGSIGKGHKNTTVRSTIGFN